MESIDYTELVNSRLTGLFSKDNGVFAAIVTSITDTLDQYQSEYINIISNLLSIDNSEGAQLDLIGKIVGQDRVLANFYDTPYFGFEDAPLAQSFGTVSNPSTGGKFRSITNTNVGENRLLTDVEYRRIIKARILKNNSRSTLNDFLQVVNMIDNSTTTSITINTSCNGVVNLVNPSNILYYFLTNRYSKDSIIPIPLGVRLGITLIESELPPIGIEP